MENKERKFVATCSTGLEEILKGEVEKCGCEVESVGKNTVSFYADTRSIYMLNMSSRVAVHILRYIDNFFFRNADDIYNRVFRIEWEKYFSYDKTIRIDMKGSTKNLKNTHFGVLRVKDGIVDRFKDKTGERPSISKGDPDIQITIYVNENQAIIYMDSCGLPLFKRGYRIQHGDAPIKEDLAAGILLLAGYDGTKDFLDPMCGSGTFLFEAYMIACTIAPNVDRKFAFMNWHEFDKPLYEVVKTELIDKEKRLETTISGFEKDSKTAILANVIKKDFFNDKKIKIMTCDFRKVEETFEKYVIVTNPPYGERIKTDNDITLFYKEIGDFFKKNCTGSEGFIFTANLEAAKYIGLRTSAKIPLFNGPLEARLLKYQMY